MRTGQGQCAGGIRRPKGNKKRDSDRKRTGKFYCLLSLALVVVAVVFGAFMFCSSAYYAVVAVVVVS